MTMNFMYQMRLYYYESYVTLYHYELLGRNNEFLIRNYSLHYFCKEEFAFFKSIYYLGFTEVHITATKEITSL